MPSSDKSDHPVRPAAAPSETSRSVQPSVRRIGCHQLCFGACPRAVETWGGADWALVLGASSVTAPLSTPSWTAQTRVRYRPGSQLVRRGRRTSWPSFSGPRFDWRNTWNALGSAAISPLSLARCTVPSINRRSVPRRGAQPLHHVMAGGVLSAVWMKAPLRSSRPIPLRRPNSQRAVCRSWRLANGSAGASNAELTDRGRVTHPASMIG